MPLVARIPTVFVLLWSAAGFIAGSKVIENAKKDLGIDKLPPKKRKRTRKIG